MENRTQRTIQRAVQGYLTQDGAGVHLVRVLGNTTVRDFDPILMLDSFDSTNPPDYTAGFPMHPHRGIETISYVVSGAMQHLDSLGSEDTIADGEVQWMTAGSGILHEERIPAAERLLGVQLWLNLPAKDKMVQPAYHAIRREMIPEVEIPGGKLRVLAGTYGQTQGFVSSYLPLDYYHIHLEAGQEFCLETDPDRSVMLFTLLGEICAAGTQIAAKTAAHLSQGDFITLTAGRTAAEILVMSSMPLAESVSWGGPIVMNTREELQKAFEELDTGKFIKSKVSY